MSGTAQKICMRKTPVYHRFEIEPAFSCRHLSLSRQIA